MPERSSGEDAGSDASSESLHIPAAKRRRSSQERRRRRGSESELSDVPRSAEVLITMAQLDVLVARRSDVPSLSPDRRSRRRRHRRRSASSQTSTTSTEGRETRQRVSRRRANGAGGSVQYPRARAAPAEAKTGATGAGQVQESLVSEQLGLLQQMLLPRLRLQEVWQQHGPSHMASICTGLYLRAKLPNYHHPRIARIESVVPVRPAYPLPLLAPNGTEAGKSVGCGVKLKVRTADRALYDIRLVDASRGGVTDAAEARRWVEELVRLQQPLLTSRTKDARISVVRAAIQAAKADAEALAAQQAFVARSVASQGPVTAALLLLAAVVGGRSTAAGDAQFQSHTTEGQAQTLAAAAKQGEEEAARAAGPSPAGQAVSAAQPSDISPSPALPAVPPVDVPLGVAAVVAVGALAAWMEAGNPLRAVPPYVGAAACEAAGMRLAARREEAETALVRATQRKAAARERFGAVQECVRDWHAKRGRAAAAAAGVRESRALRRLGDERGAERNRRVARDIAADLPALR
eukprot:Hpha_TRINITY_DN15191_c4_g8::TRINITY_DN15191_c4_g8_i1::g.128374::m.128374